MVETAASREVQASEDIVTGSGIKLLAKGARISAQTREHLLQPEQWRHIASHPVIGWRVLREMNGAGKQVADAVLNHHERLDGFGYPRGIADDEFPLDGQILATSEWLMALIESGIAPLARASVASKLMPGEFGKPLQQVLSQLGGVDTDMADWLQAQQPLSEMLPEIRRVMATLQRFRALRADIDAQIERAGPRLRKVLQQSLNRMLRIQSAFSSSGLDADADPERMLAELAAQGDPKVQQEVQALVREFSWRMRELQRESLLRAGLLGDVDAAVMQGLTDRLRGGGAT